jgi:hypothetical protein
MGPSVVLCSGLAMLGELAPPASVVVRVVKVEQS